MLRLNIKLDSLATQEELARVGARLRDLTPLHKVMADRLEHELKDHFRRRNTEPNNNNWEKSGWWAKVAEGTLVSEANAQYGEVTIAPGEDAQGFSYHLKGGTIRPRLASALTIPKVESAKGKFAARWEDENRGRYEESGKNGKILFRPRGTRILAAKPRGQKEGFEMIYVLAKSVTIKKDPDALPPDIEMQLAVTEEAGDWVKREIKKAKGGTA